MSPGNVWPPDSDYYYYFLKQFNKARDVAQLVTHLLSMHKPLDVITPTPTLQCWGEHRKKNYY